MGSYFSAQPSEEDEILRNNKQHARAIPTLEEILNNPVDATLLINKDPTQLKLLSNLLQTKKYAIIRPTQQQADQILQTRKKVEEFFDKDDEFKFRYEIPPSTDPLLPTRRNRGYLPQPHKEYLKIRMIDDDESYPDIPELRSNFKESMEFLYQICSSALLALSSRRVGSGEIEDDESTVAELMVTSEEIDGERPPHPSNSSRWVDLSSIQLCNTWIPRGSSVSVVRYLASGEVADHDKNEYASEKNDVTIATSVGDENNNNNNEDADAESKIRNVCGAHYDTGLLTCIRVSEVPGLQVFDEQLGEWISLEKVGKAGDLVLIMGRKITLVSNQLANLAPTYHRVILPSGIVRHSILYFCDLPTNKDQ